MLISQFDYKAPTTIKEVLSCLHAHPDAAILSGGYSLISLMKSGVIDPDFIISTEQIQTLKKIDTESDGSVIIGSSVSLSTLLDHSSVGITFPSLKEVINNIADRQYCNQTSIGDEFSYQGGSMGVLAVLLSYGAEFHFSNANGIETIKGLTLGEKPKKAILTSIQLRPPNGITYVHEMNDPISRLPLCGIAAQIHGSKNAVQASNFTVYGKGLTPFRLTEIEDHIQEAGIASALKHEKIGEALSKIVQKSPANPAYFINLVYSFTKKAMLSV